MLTLHVFAPALGTISPSPFSVKALLLLQMSGLPFTRVAGDPRRAPKQKLPVLEDEGRLIPDSEAIRAHRTRAHGVAPAPAPRTLRGVRTPRAAPRGPCGRARR